MEARKTQAHPASIDDLLMLKITKILAAGIRGSRQQSQVENTHFPFLACSLRENCRSPHFPDESPSISQCGLSLVWSQLVSVPAFDLPRPLAARLDEASHVTPLLSLQYGGETAPLCAVLQFALHTTGCLRIVTIAFVCNNSSKNHIEAFSLPCGSIATAMNQESAPSRLMIQRNRER